MDEIIELNKYYGRFAAVRNLSLIIEDGSIFGLVGPNGAGKTTTMNIMSGLLTATSGSILINGVNVIKTPQGLRESIGFMPDFFGVYDNLKVNEYMDFFEGAYGIPYADRSELTGNLLELVDLKDKKDEYVDTLSRGMKQRLCLARCLVHDPDVLILDEPASGLDPRARVELKEILKQLKQMGKTIIISSHILTELSELCTHVGIINNGRVVAAGTITDILKSMKKKRLFYIKSLDKNKELIRVLDEIPNVSDTMENTEDIEFAFSGTDEELAVLLKNIVLRDLPVISFKEREGNLEELFMELTDSANNNSLGVGANA